MSIFNKIEWTEPLNPETGLRKGIKTETGFCEDRVVFVPFSEPPKIESKFVKEMYDLYPHLTKINSKVSVILGKNFHIDRLTHSLGNSIKHWRYLFDWNAVYDENYKNVYNRKGSYDSFKQEINSQAFSQLKCGLTFSVLPLREIEIAFNILESALKIAKDNDGELSYNFVGKSFDLTEDVIVSYDEIQKFISEKLNKFISEF